MSADDRSRKEASSWICKTATQCYLLDEAADLRPGVKVADPGVKAAEPSALAADAGAAAADPMTSLTSRARMSCRTSTKASRTRMMDVLEHPATPTPTRSRQESAKLRAQAPGQESATFARNSGVMALLSFFFLPILILCSCCSAFLLAFRAHWSW